MTDVPDIPPPPSPPPGPPPRYSGGTLIALGIVGGIVVLFALYLLIILLVGPSWPAAFGPIVVFSAVAVWLAVRPRTRMFGTGLLIGLGVWALLGGGLCVPLLIPSGGVS